MNPEHIEDDERLFRFVANDGVNWSKKRNRPSTAAFKKAHGCSVDRQGERSAEEAIEALLRGRPSGYGAVSFLAGNCRRWDFDPVPDPLPDNPFHGLLLNSNGGTDLKPEDSLRKFLKQDIRHDRVPTF